MQQKQKDRGYRARETLRPESGESIQVQKRRAGNIRGPEEVCWGPWQRLGSLLDTLIRARAGFVGQFSSGASSAALALGTRRLPPTDSQWR